MAASSAIRATVKRINKNNRDNASIRWGKDKTNENKREWLDATQSLFGSNLGYFSLHFFETHSET